jgi:hypothetical protein
MLLITDDLLRNYLEVNEKLKLNVFFNKKQFTVSNTPLTYKQINSLESDKLIEFNRKSTQTWRKFSFKELVYILIVHELKNFGMKHVKLKGLWRSFFHESKKVKLDKIEFNKLISECAIGCTFGKREIMLAIDSDGNITFYDPPHSLIIDDIIGDKPQIVIRLNDIVNNLLKQIGKEPISIIHTRNQLVLDLAKDTSSKEEALLKIIRDKDFTVITVKKKNNEITVVQAERINKTETNFRLKDLINLISARDYQDINIIKQDGKIVNLKIEETYKMS